MRLRLTPALLSLLLLAAGCPSLPTLYAKHFDQPFTKSAPQRVRIGDFSQEGPDVVTVNQGTGGLSVLWNDGTGRLSAPVALDTGTPGPVVDAGIANVAGDKWPDILALRPTGVVVLEDQGGAAFQVPATGGHLAPGSGDRDLLVGDFNGDGVTDLFIVSDTGSDLWLGPDFKTAQVPRPPALLPDPAPFVANVDGVAGDDVVGVRQGASGKELVVLLGQASGRFTVQVAPPLPSGDAIAAIAPARFAGGSFTDILVGGKGFLAGYHRTDTGFGTLTLAKVAGLDPLAVAAGGIGNGQEDDLVVANRDGRLLTFLSQNHGSAEYRAAPPQAVGPSPTGLALADMDRAWSDDIVVSTQGTCCPLKGAGVEVLTGGVLPGSSGTALDFLAAP